MLDDYFNKNIIHRTKVYHSIDATTYTKSNFLNDKTLSPVTDNTNSIGTSETATSYWKKNLA